MLACLLNAELIKLLPELLSVVELLSVLPEAVFGRVMEEESRPNAAATQLDFWEDELPPPKELLPKEPKLFFVLALDRSDLRFVVSGVVGGRSGTGGTEEELDCSRRLVFDFWDLKLAKLIAFMSF